MKDFFRAIFILAFFAFIGLATSKSLIPSPCDIQISRYLDTDQTVRGYYQAFAADTIVVKAYKDSLWDIKSAEVCRLLRDSCRLNGRKVLVVDTTWNPTLFDTRFGKKIYFRHCP
jgi:hypothetical protein